MPDEFEDYRNEVVRETNGQAISRSLTSARSGRAGIPQEFRERQQVAKESDQEWRRKMGEERLSIAKDAAQVAREAAIAKAAEVKFGLVSKRLEAQEKAQVFTHSTAALEELSSLDYKDGATPNRIADIYRRNPRALDNTGVRSIADKMLGMHETYLKDFRTDKLSENEKQAAQVAEDQLIADGLKRKGATVKVGNTTSDFEAPPDAKAKDAGTITISSDGEKTRQSVTKPLTPDAELKALQDQHKVLEAGLNGTKGDDRLKKIEQINALKAKLGYQLLYPDGTLTPAPTPPVATDKETKPAFTVGNPSGGGSAPAPSQASPPVTPTAPVIDAKSQAAIKWLEENPSDPRAESVRKKLGL